MSEPKTAFFPPVPRGPTSVPEARSNSRTKLLSPGANNSQRPGAGAAQSMTSHVALNAMRRWWKIALPLGLLLSAAAAGLVYWSFEPLYEAKAMLEINEMAPYIAFEPRDGGVSKSYFHTQMEIIRSTWIMGRTVANAAIKELPEIRKQADPIDWLRKKVSAAPSNDSNVFEIKYSSADPESAALVVNEVTRQYLKAQEEEESARYRNIIKALEQELTARRDTVKTLQKQMADQENLALPPDDPEPPRGEERPVFKNPVAELQSQLVSVQVELAMKRAMIKAMEEEIQKAEAVPAPSQQADGKALPNDAKATRERVPPVEARDPARPSNARPGKKTRPALTPDEIDMRDELVERALETAPEMREAEMRLVDKQTALDDLEKALVQGKKDPLYVKAQNDIKFGEKRLQELKKKLRPRFEKNMEFAMRAGQGEHGAGPVNEVPILARRKAELAQLKIELRGLEIAEDDLKKAYSTQFGKLLKERQDLSGEALSFRFKKDELHEAQAVLGRIQDRMIALTTERSAPPRVIWHEQAKVPNVPTELLPIRNMALAGLLAFCLPFGLAIGWEFRTRRIGSPDELERELHMTVLGEIARLPTRVRAAPQMAAKRIGSELRIFEESVDSLRTSLTLCDDLRDMRILAITSAANHEGKTSVASQLALSLARATGKATLLIDGDMRSPDVHKVFSVARGPGLAEVLGNECSLADAIVGTHNPNVQLLPAGRLKVSPHRLLGNGAWKSLLAQVPASYGYVIIDTPPVLAASEALVLSKYADAILICVMRDVSRADQVRKASNMLTAAGGCPVGTVLNGVPISRYKYYYGTYPAAPASSPS